MPHRAPQPDVSRLIFRAVGATIARMPGTASAKRSTKATTKNAPAPAKAPPAKKSAKASAPAPAKAPPAKKSGKASAPERFEGFASDDMKFFRTLAKHQDRDWFAEHKAEYDEGWAAPMAALLAETRAALDRAYPDCELSEPKVFRIYRDVRFGADKSPFKTHVSGVISAKPRSKVTEAPAAVYLQLGTETFAGAGLYMMDGRALASFRSAVLDGERGAEVEKFLRALEKRGFSAASHDTLKSAPRGIDPDHPRIALLKRKGLVVSFPEIPKGLIATRGLLDWVVTQSKLAAPLVRWLVYNTV